MDITNIINSEYQKLINNLVDNGFTKYCSKIDTDFWGKDGIRIEVKHELHNVVISVTVFYL